MKYETLLKIYFELAAKRSISVHALAEKYHLSPRTIHRYLEELEKRGSRSTPNGEKTAALPSWTLTAFPPPALPQRNTA